MNKGKNWAIVFGLAFAFAGLGIQYGISGISTAQGEPSVIVNKLTKWVLHASVPEEQKNRSNPLVGNADAANAKAGHEIYQSKCETCHAYDGSGRTNIAGSQYPRPPNLREPEVQGQTDGELAYHIREGIKHTGMPHFDLPDLKTWQLVLYLRNLPKVVSVVTENPEQVSELKPKGHEYLGSESCKSCHEDIYQRWRKTRMANVVRDPKLYPDAILPPLDKLDPLLTFSQNDIALVYGSKWKQRYFKKVGDDYFPLPAQWDVTHKQWRPYFVKDGTDWWTKHYPADNFQRPTGPAL